MYDGYFCFSRLNTLHSFSLKLMTNKSHKTGKCKNKWGLILASRRYLPVIAVLFIIYMLFMITNHILKLFACAQTPNYCCVILWIYLKLLLIYNDSDPFNDSLFWLHKCWKIHCVECLTTVRIHERKYSNIISFTKNSVTRFKLCKGLCKL